MMVSESESASVLLSKRATPFLYCGFFFPPVLALAVALGVSIGLLAPMIESDEGFGCLGVVTPLLELAARFRIVNAWGRFDGPDEYPSAVSLEISGFEALERGTVLEADPESPEGVFD